MCFMDELASVRDVGRISRRRSEMYQASNRHKSTLDAFVPLK